MREQAYFLRELRQIFEHFLNIHLAVSEGEGLVLMIEFSGCAKIESTSRTSNIILIIIPRVQTHIHVLPPRARQDQPCTVLGIPRLDTNGDPVCKGAHV
jgi:hypothetical protein